MDTTLTKTERYERLIGYCGSKAELARRINIDPNAITQYLKRGTYDPERISNGFSELSNDWILHGKGPMFESDIEYQQDRALSLLGITIDEVDEIKRRRQHPQDNNNECTPAHVYTQAPPQQPLFVAEGDNVDRALLNLLLREKSALEARLATKDQELEVLRTRNLELERANARLEERFAGATAWYHRAITTHPDLKSE